MSHYLNQCWYRLLTHICVTRQRYVKWITTYRLRTTMGQYLSPFYHNAFGICNFNTYCELWFNFLLDTGCIKTGHWYAASVYVTSKSYNRQFPFSKIDNTENWQYFPFVYKCPGGPSPLQTHIGDNDCTFPWHCHLADNIVSFLLNQEHIVLNIHHTNIASMKYGLIENMYVLPQKTRECVFTNKWPY